MPKRKISGRHLCPACRKTGFASAKGLAIHAMKIHQSTMFQLTSLSLSQRKKRSNVSNVSHDGDSMNEEDDDRTSSSDKAGGFDDSHELAARRGVDLCPSKTSVIYV